MQVAVVKYNAGNIFSVMNALGRLGVEAKLTDDAARAGGAGDLAGVVAIGDRCGIFRSGVGAEDAGKAAAEAETDRGQENPE